MRFREKYYFLSNFYPHPIEYQGITYRTSEHAYQAQKFRDKTIQEEIRMAETPAEAKRIAREHSDKIHKDWKDIKISVMYQILTEKFKDPELEDKLLSVDEPIIEDNHWGDTFWGVCEEEGENNLGKILTRIKREKQVFS